MLCVHHSWWKGLVHPVVIQASRRSELPSSQSLPITQPEIKVTVKSGSFPNISEVLSQTLRLVTSIDHWSQGPTHLWVGVGEWEAPEPRREENQKFPVSSTDDSQLHSEATDRPFQEVPSFSSILEAKARHGQSMRGLLSLMTSCPAQLPL